MTSRMSVTDTCATFLVKMSFIDDIFPVITICNMYNMYIKSYDTVLFLDSSYIGYCMTLQQQILLELRNQNKVSVTRMY